MNWLVSSFVGYCCCQVDWVCYLSCELLNEFVNYGVFRKWYESDVRRWLRSWLWEYIVIVMEVIGIEWISWMYNLNYNDGVKNVVNCNWRIYIPVDTGFVSCSFSCLGRSPTVGVWNVIKILALSLIMNDTFFYTDDVDVDVFLALIKFWGRLDTS